MLPVAVFAQLPVGVERQVLSGAGIPYELQPVRNLAEVGIINPLDLTKADNIVSGAIARHAFPGCRVLAAKDGKVFYDKSFGYFTYDTSQRVTASTVYDLASLTKVVSTTLAVMRLTEQGKLNLDRPLGDYLPAVCGTNKEDLLIRHLLLHQAGLKSWIPFYKSFLDSNHHLSDTVFKAARTNHFSIEVAKNLYLRSDYRDTIWKMIYASPLENVGRMVYSDLDYYFLAAVVEKITGKTIDRYVAEQFYTPMGLKTIGYLPLGFLNANNIAPTENDTLFRRQQLRGYVHDPGAALLGGVAGHAGVFATAGDVAALFQMLLNGGSYRGRQYFMPETVRYFTAYGSPLSRRGLGFDKPVADREEAVVTSRQCSGYTFGHQGFTGTCVWADPATGVLFVFLSNRVYPDQENNLIVKLGVRTELQSALYEAMGIKDDTGRATVKAMQMKARP